MTVEISSDVSRFVMFSDLVLEDEIGRGMFGVVHRGHYVPTGQKVAIKKLVECEDIDTAKYYLREAEIMEKLDHPFVLGFVGLSRDETDLYIVTDFVDGGDLRQLIEKEDMPWKQRIDFAIQMAIALDYLHTQCIVHRDMKTDNVLVDKLRERIYVCDFGLSRPVELNKKKAMSICGTDATMAPELMFCMDYSEMVDIFSYGVVLCELISRKQPGLSIFPRVVPGFGIDEDEIRERANDGCPDGLITLTIHCVEAEPDDRPPLIEIIDDLKVIYKESTDSDYLLPNLNKSLSTEDSASPKADAETEAAADEHAVKSSAKDLSDSFTAPLDYITSGPQQRPRGISGGASLQVSLLDLLSLDSAQERQVAPKTLNKIKSSQNLLFDNEKDSSRIYNTNSGDLKSPNKSVSIMNILTHDFSTKKSLFSPKADKTGKMTAKERDKDDKKLKKEVARSGKELIKAHRRVNSKTATPSSEGGPSDSYQHSTSPKSEMRPRLFSGSGEKPGSSDVMNFVVRLLASIQVTPVDSPGNAGNEAVARGIGSRSNTLERNENRLKKLKTAMMRVSHHENVIDRQHEWNTFIKAFKGAMPVSDRQRRLRTYRNVFSGLDCVNFIVYFIGCHRDESLQLAQLLYELKIFENVQGKQHFKGVKSSLFRFACNHEPQGTSRQSSLPERVMEDVDSSLEPYTI